MTDYIVESLRPLAEPIDDAHLDPANTRTGHAIDKIAASLSLYKQRKPIVVNQSENNKIEAGNGTWQAAKSLGWSHIAMVFVEDDPMTAVGFGIADNRLGDLSSWDFEALGNLLGGLDSDLNLVTGFDDGELDDLLDGLGEQGEDAEGIDPSLIPNEDRYVEQYGVIVICANEAEQEKTYNTLSKAGHNCRVVTT